MLIKIEYTCLNTAGTRKMENTTTYQIDTNNENWKEKVKKEFNDIVENERDLIYIRIGV